jgi:hypothetical protein
MLRFLFPKNIALTSNLELDILVTFGAILHTMTAEQLVLVNLHHQSNLLQNGEYFTLTDKKETLYRYDMNYINVWYKYCHPLFTNNHETDLYKLNRAFNSAKIDHEKLANLTFILRNIDTEQLKLLICQSQLITNLDVKLVADLGSLGNWKVPVTTMKLWSNIINNNLLQHVYSFAN